MYSYYRRGANLDVVDFLNQKCNVWRHPYDSEIMSNADVFMLIEQAKKEAVNMISAAHAVIFCKKNISLKQLYGNSNYSTGFDCRDIRNNNKPTYGPLVYKGKYWNDT